VEEIKSFFPFKVFLTYKIISWKCLISYPFPMGRKPNGVRNPEGLDNSGRKESQKPKHSCASYAGCNIEGGIPTASARKGSTLSGQKLDLSKPTTRDCDFCHVLLLRLGRARQGDKTTSVSAVRCLGCEGLSYDLDLLR